MTYLFPAAPVHSLAIVGRAERFPVNRVFCVGRNYAAHAREMGQDEREPPFFFMKPASAVVDASIGETRIPYPPETENFHHEIELVIAVGRGGASIAQEAALDHVHGYAVGLDMTRRDLQFQARDKGRPWEFGKAFSHSAPMGAISAAAEIGHPRDGAITLSVNGSTRQASRLSLMIWSAAEAIAYLSRFEPLQAGDLIMSGTPEGVGPVVSGDVMLGQIERLRDIRVRVT